MSILVNKATRVIVQGITGKEGSFHARACRDYGTQIVAGVTPGKGGSDFEGVKVYDTVEEAVRATSPQVSMIFVPPAFAADAILEAASTGIELIVCITEGIPVMDMIQVKRFLVGNGPASGLASDGPVRGGIGGAPAPHGPPQIKRCRLIGPNCPGIITPEECKIGIMPGFIHKKGKVGVISRSGTLTYEAV